MKKYLVEFIGTFFLILTIVMTVATGSAMAPLAIGSILMVMVYAGGHISGAHYNPAVTLAVWMRGKCDTSDVPFYMISQVAGAALAGAVGTFLAGSLGAEWKQFSATSPVPGLIGEFLGTFALCWVVLNTATSKGTAGNSFYGLAIGFTVLACAWGLGGLSGGAFNPAVAVGAVVGGLSTASYIWVPLVACFAGGAVAALVFGFVRDEDDV